MKVAMPPLAKLTRNDWQFTLQIFLPVLLALMVISAGQCSQQHPAPEQVVAAIEADAKPAPIPVKLQWPTSYFRIGDHEANPASPLQEGTPLGHITSHERPKSGRTIKVWNLWVLISDGKGHDEAREINYCRDAVPIIENDWDAGAQDDGCDGCEGPLTNLLGYRDYCGPFGYYEKDDCTRSAFEIGGDWLVTKFPHIMGDDNETVIRRDRAEFQCRATLTDEYPINEVEERSWRPFNQWPWYSKLDPVYRQ